MHAALARIHPKRGRGEGGGESRRIFDSNSKRDKTNKICFAKQYERQTIFFFFWVGGVQSSRTRRSSRGEVRGTFNDSTGREVAEFASGARLEESGGRYGRREDRSVITETFDRARRSIRATECLYAPFAALHKLLQLRAYVIRRFAINLVPHHPSTNLFPRVRISSRSAGEIDRALISGGNFRNRLADE